MRTSSKKFWWRFELDVPYLLEETLIWKFESIGITSFAIEVSPEKSELHRLFVWFPSSEWDQKQLEEFNFCLQPLAQTFDITLPPPQYAKTEDQDWSLAWKTYWKPDPVGSSILILPAWINIPLTFSNRKIVRIDPGIAFGTGSHPSTRLCLEALERYPLENLTIADIGCGSGILGLTALALGSNKVFAVDTDSLAINSAKNNFLLNDFHSDSFFVSHGSIDRLKLELNEDQVDLILCNILLPVIKLLAPEFDEILKCNGVALLSGILVDQIKELLDFLKPLGWQICNSLEKSNWALLEIKRS